MMNTCTCDCRKCKQCLNKDGEESKIKVSKIQISIWFDRWKKESYIKLYQTMLQNYNRTNELVYSNLQDKFEEYRQEEYNKLINDSVGTHVDPADIDYSEIESEAAYRVERDLLMKYQFHFISLVNIYQVFEQQIRKLLFTELNHKLSPVRTKEEMPEFATKFGDIKSVLKELNFSIGEIPSWSTIDELNKISNTYKHGDGNSAKSLYRKNRDIFANKATRFFYYEEPRSKEEERAYIRSLDEDELEDYMENEKILLMEYELTTNSEIVLRQDNTPFEKYVNAIISFWESFPEHYTTQIDVEEEVKEVDVS